MKHALMVPAPTAATRTDSWLSPSSVVSRMYEAFAPLVAHMPAVEFTLTVVAFASGVSGSHAIVDGVVIAVVIIVGIGTSGFGPGGPGNPIRPAWPTSCCRSSVAPRMPLCISVRLAIVRCEFDI
jgi:hypothetical protein